MLTSSRKEHCSLNPGYFQAINSTQDQAPLFFCTELWQDIRVMLLGISLEVPQEIHNYVRNLQFEFKEKYNVVLGLDQPPHITLKRPFEREDSTEFENFLSAYVKTLKKFRVNIQGFGFFEEGVIFLRVIESENLNRLKTQICNYLEEKLNVAQDDLEKDGFVFHLTLAYGDVSQETLERIKKDYLSKDVRFTFLTKSISLLRNSGEKWLPTKIFILND
ncbi:2'-5' RNA ligase family protein [Candidatus Riflebacteria bacterium]